MLHVSLFEEFDIRVYELDAWEFAPHKHTFFEMIYIVAGEGVHCINDHALDYTAGSLFLLTPADTHDFEILTPSRFCIITFAKIYFSKRRNSNSTNEAGLGDVIDFSEMFTQVEHIFYNHSTSQAAIELATSEHTFCDHIIQQLMWEVEQKNCSMPILCGI
jgi:AraC family transcriptional regulator, L-rhamnose operon regulatory protein RhaS